MKKISKVAALLAASALLFGGMFLSCSDSDDDGNTGGGSGTTKPTPTPTPTPTPEPGTGDSLVYNMDDITITDEGTVGQKVLFDGGLTVVNTSAGKIKITANSAGTHHYIQASCGANSLGALSSQTGYLKVKASKAGTEKITFTFTTVKSTKGESENYIYLIDENSQELGRSSVIKCPTTDSDTELTREIQATVPEYFYVVFVRGAGSGGFKFTKIEQAAIAKAKSSQTAPAAANFAATACTTKDQNDGKITISNETVANLEYKLSTADSYADVTGSSLENLAAGTYQFRYKETDNTLASEAIEVVVEKYVDTSISFTKFDAKELYGDATDDVTITENIAAANGTWTLVADSSNKAQVKAGTFETYDYVEGTNGYSWTNRLSYNKKTGVTLKLKVGAGATKILRVDGGSVKTLPSSGKTNLTFKGAGDAVVWEPYVSNSTTYVEVTGDADGYVSITSTDTTNGANIYGITVVESKPATLPGAFELSTKLTTAAVYSKPVINAGYTAVATQGETLSGTATLTQPTKSTATPVYADGSLGTATEGTETVEESAVTWTTTYGENVLTLGTGLSLAFATSATATDTNYVPAGTYSVTASYKIGETAYTSDPISVQVKEAGATYVTVTFNANGGTNGTVTTQDVASGAATALKTVAELGLTAPSGKTFAGWALSADATEAVYTDGANITVTAATTLYAVWKAATVAQTIASFGFDGSSAPAADSTVTGTNMSVTYKTTDTSKTFSNESVTYADGVADEYKASYSKGVKFGANALYIALTLTETDATFKAGDIIYITGYNTYGVSDDSSKLNANSTLGVCDTGATAKGAINVGSLTLPEGTYTNTLYLSRGTSSGSTIANIVIKRK